jgi:hypothetical protein
MIGSLSQLNNKAAACVIQRSSSYDETTQHDNQEVMLNSVASKDSDTTRSEHKNQHTTNQLLE